MLVACGCPLVRQLPPDAMFATIVIDAIARHGIERRGEWAGTVGHPIDQHIVPRGEKSGSGYPVWPAIGQQPRR